MLDFQPTLFLSPAIKGPFSNAQVLADFSIFPPGKASSASGMTSYQRFSSSMQIFVVCWFRAASSLAIQRRSMAESGSHDAGKAPAAWETPPASRPLFPPGFCRCGRFKFIQGDGAVTVVELEDTDLAVFLGDRRSAFWLE
jgi:hypothetical protein